MISQQYTTLQFFIVIDHKLMKKATTKQNKIFDKFIFKTEYWTSLYLKQKILAIKSNCSVSNRIYFIKFTTLSYMLTGNASY